MPNSQQADRARQLMELSNGRVTVRFEPNLETDRIPGSAGHMYWGLLSAHHDDFQEGIIYLDDRGDDLDEQLVGELRRIAAYYSRVADETEESLMALA